MSDKKKVVKLRKVKYCPFCNREYKPIKIDEAWVRDMVMELHDLIIKPSECGDKKCEALKKAEKFIRQIINVAKGKY